MVKPQFANFGHTNAKVPIFKANGFLSGWNEFKMIEYPLMLVYPADSAVKPRLLANFVLMLEFKFLKQISSMWLEWVENDWKLSHTSKYCQLGFKKPPFS